MDKQEFRDMVERLRKDTKHFSNIEVLDSEWKEDGGLGDTVIFDMEYGSIDEMGIVKKRLKIHRFPDTAEDGSPILVLGGKIIISESKKCPTCGHEEWKNVTREVGAKLLGGSVPGW